jgi:hypothetical protein
MRFYYSADCALIAAGTIRGDQIYPPGVLKLRDIVNCFPFEDPVVLIRVPGAAIIKAIENGLSKLPAFEGRFSHVSNIYYTYDASLPAGGRVVSCKIGEEIMDPYKQYSLATRQYMASGKDGYTALTESEYIIDEENGVLISTILRQYFLSLKVMGKWSRGGQFREFFGGLKSEMAHKGELVESESAKKRKGDGNNEDIESGSDNDDEEIQNSTVHESDLSSEDKTSELVQKAGLKWARLAGVKGSKECDWAQGIAPRVEGRITPV